MDELTSVFYAPAEAHRFIGPAAIFFIALTSILIRFFSSRLVEISEILEHHKLFGGGVYSFSYLVLGPVISFVAVSSIMVDYILTACISAISAIENAASFFSVPQLWKMITAIVIVWGIAGLNILGIRENVRFTFGVFILGAFVFLNLIASGILGLDHDSLIRLKDSVAGAAENSGKWVPDSRLRRFHCFGRQLRVGLFRGGVCPPNCGIRSDLARHL